MGTLGAIFEIPIRDGFAYIQRTHVAKKSAQLPSAVRVLPGIFKTRPDVQRLAAEEEILWILFDALYFVRTKKISFVAVAPVPVMAPEFPTFLQYRTRPGMYLVANESGIVEVALPDDLIEGLPRFVIESYEGLVSSIILYDALKRGGMSPPLGVAYAAFFHSAEAARAALNDAALELDRFHGVVQNTVPTGWHLLLTGEKSPIVPTEVAQISRIVKAHGGHLEAFGDAISGVPKELTIGRSALSSSVITAAEELQRVVVGKSSDESVGAKEIVYFTHFVRERDARAALAEVAGKLPESFAAEVEFDDDYNWLLLVKGVASKATPDLVVVLKKAAKHFDGKYDGFDIAL